MTNEEPTNRRRWLRYSLRTLFVLVTLFCIWLGLYAQRQRDRHAAIETIKGWGADIAFAERRPSIADEMKRMELTFKAHKEGAPRPVFPEQLPQGPAWLRALFGKYCGSDVVSVSGPYAHPLHEIDLRPLAPLNEVRRLGLSNVYITDDVLRRLPRLPNVTSLRLSFTSMTDAGLECLERLPALSSLQISRCSVSDAGMAEIAKVRGLTFLMLSDVNLTDAGVEPLTKLQQLGQLWLTDTSISDAAVVHLCRLKGLKRLDVSGTYVSEDGIRRLKENLPNCEIVYRDR